MTDEAKDEDRLAFRKNTILFWREIALFTEIAEALLSSGKLTEKDAVLVRRKQKVLRELVATISKLHEKAVGPFPSVPPGIAYHGCSHLMSIASVLGSLGVQFESTKRLLEQGLKEDHAQRMRDARAKHGAQACATLLEAIEAERGTGPAPRPSKTAREILPKVNARLKAAGYDPVNVNQVRYQLEKLRDS